VEKVGYKWANGGDPCDAAKPWYGVSCTLVTERTLPDLWKLKAPSSGITGLILAMNPLRGPMVLRSSTWIYQGTTGGESCLGQCFKPCRGFTVSL